MFLEGSSCQEQVGEGGGAGGGKGESVSIFVKINCESRHNNLKF